MLRIKVEKVSPVSQSAQFPKGVLQVNELNARGELRKKS